MPVAITASCPVRDGRLSVGGCSFCGGRSFVPPYCKETDAIDVQIAKGIDFFSHKHSSAQRITYLAYFQSGTSTYGDIACFKEACLSALSHPQVAGLVISTRPDCLHDDWLQLLDDLSKKCFVCVELGVESLDDEVLRRVNRHHDVSTVLHTLDNLSSLGIPVCTHLILGLPGEREGAVVNAARMLSSLPVDVVKLHQLQIVRGSRFACQYMRHPENFRLYSLDTYVHDVADFLEYLSPHIAVERFVSETPKRDLLAPSWGVRPDEVTRRVVAEMFTRGSVQGCCL